MKRILLGVLTIGLISTFAIGATRAYFSSQGISSNNTFATGTLDLRLSDINEIDQESVTASWSDLNMVPGGTAVFGTIQLKNSGTILGNHVDVVVDNMCDEIDMDSYLEITSASFDGENILGSIFDKNDNKYKDLNDLQQTDDSLTGLDNLILADINVSHSFTLSIRLHAETPNDYQGKSCNSVFTFTLNQDISQ
ncbi:MAG: TasA family protein [Candidatus Shapirobacteria bacterium]|nr:TasA family protein [Candidatus Shapirobacteria bacterium]